MRKTNRLTAFLPFVLAVLLGISAAAIGAIAKPTNVGKTDVVAYSASEAEVMDNADLASAALSASTFNASALNGIVEYNEEDFTVSLNQSAPMVSDTWGDVIERYAQYSYQDRQVQLDERKLGLLVSSKQSGVAAEGKSFMLGGEMSGEFSIDFRIPSAESYETQYWDNTNHYADVQKVVFTFTDVATSQSFDVTIRSYGGNDGSAKCNIPSMYVKLPDGSIKGYNYQNTVYADYTSAEVFQSWALNEPNYYTELYGTSFANAAEVFCGGGFTAGAKSTKFYFDPVNLVVSADRYMRDGTLGEGKYAGEPVYNNQVFDGRTCVLRSDNIEVLDMKEHASDLITATFEKYTVEVTFEEMTSNDTVAKVKGEEKTYERYANMYIYSLNGENLVTDPVAHDSVEQGEFYTAPEGDDDFCVVSYATLNLAEFDYDKMSEFGVVVKKVGEGKAYKYKFDKENKAPADNKYGIAIYGLAAGDYVFADYVIYNGILFLTDTVSVTVQTA